MLTKSSFLTYQHCPKSFWLSVRRPELMKAAPPSLFLRKILADGYEVEHAFGALVATWPEATLFGGQVTFEIDGLLARADFVRSNADGSIDIFEAKGSTSIKDEHLVDATFQTIVAELAGQSVRRVHIVHLNKAYIRAGELDLTTLLAIVDVTDKVAALRPEVEQQIDEAMKLLLTEEIDEDGCDCIYFGNPDNRCAGFEHLNAEIPEPSIYLLPRISAVKVRRFVDERRLALADVSPDELTNLQLAVHQSAVRGAPVIDHAAIRAFLADLSWPIHFYDYETCNPPVPQADGHRPSQQIVVQYSLHVLHEDGRLDHHEWLSDGYGAERALAQSLASVVGADGSAVVWNETFERSRNRELGELFPDMVEFFTDLNARTIDLMVPFKSAYVDIAFEGSTSIKKVLPVVCPHLQYDQSSVHDGGGAMEAWMRMASGDDAEEKAKLRVELLAYCGLDTLAMVEIFRFLQRVAA